MFKQAATEPWMANWRRLRTISIFVTEHLVLLSFDTSYTEKINMADIHKLRGTAIVTLKGVLWERLK